MVKKKKEYYKQCTFQQTSETGTAITIGWANEVRGKLGNVVSIEGLDGKWKVICVGPHRRSAEERKNHELDWKKQRRVSDI